MLRQTISYLCCVGFLWTVVTFQSSTASTPTVLKSLPSGKDIIRAGSSYIIPLKSHPTLNEHDRILYVHNVLSGSRLMLGRVTGTDTIYQWTVDPCQNDLLRLVVADAKTGRLLESSASYFRINSTSESTERVEHVVDIMSMRLTTPEEEFDRIVKDGAMNTSQLLVSAITYDGRVLDIYSVTGANAFEFSSFCRKWTTVSGIVYFTIQSGNRLSLVRFN